MAHKFWRVASILVKYRENLQPYREDVTTVRNIIHSNKYLTSYSRDMRM
jgi:hypothetical protein